MIDIQELKRPNQKPQTLFHNIQDKFWSIYINSWLDDLYTYSWLWRTRWFLYHWFHKSHHVKTDLPIGYHDKRELMEQAVFQLVVDFMSKDKEDAYNRIVFSDELFREVYDILHFVYIDKPALEKEYEDLLDDLYGGADWSWEDSDREGIKLFKGFLFTKNKYTEEERSMLTKALRCIECKIYEDTQEMLKRCIDIREWLWT